MLLQMFLNELSLTPLADDVVMAQNRIREYVHTMRAATSKGVQRMIHLPAEFYANPIAQGYYWQSWLNDNRVERELRQYFLTLATKVPFLQGNGAVEVAWGEIDCIWSAQPALGLKAAHVADGLAVSMLSSADWDRDSIDCEIQEIIDGEIISRNETIHHAASERHVEAQTNWIRQRIQSAVADGRELWKLSAEFFPLLTYCAAVEDQMKALPAQSLASITRGLFRLNEYCLGWQGGGFDSRLIDCDVSPDSQPTLQQYAPERTFLCPDGNHRTFSWHAKVGQSRIYFDYAIGPGHLLIGYVGSHLRTVRHN